MPELHSYQSEMDNPLSDYESGEQYKTPLSTGLETRLERGLAYGTEAINNAMGIDQLNRPDNEYYDPDTLERVANSWLTPQQAKDKYGISVNNGQKITEAAARSIYDFKQQDQQRERVLSREGKDLGTQALGFGAELLGSMLDPLNLGLSFVPFIGEARGLQLMTRFGPTLGRAVVGATEGALGNAVLEPFVYNAARTLNYDYDEWDSFMNIAAGGIIGAGAHVAFGKVGDILGISNWAKHVDAGRIEPNTHHDMLRTAVGQIVEDKNIMIDPIYRESLRSDELISVHDFMNKFDWDQHDVKLRIGDKETERFTTTAGLAYDDFFNIVFTEKGLGIKSGESVESHYKRIISHYENKWGLDSGTIKLELTSLGSGQIGGVKPKFVNGELTDLKFQLDKEKLSLSTLRHELEHVRDLLVEDYITVQAKQNSSSLVKDMDRARMIRAGIDEGKIGDRHHKHYTDFNTEYLYDQLKKYRPDLLRKDLLSNLKNAEDVRDQVITPLSDEDNFDELTKIKEEIANYHTQEGKWYYDPKISEQIDANLKDAPTKFDDTDAQKSLDDTMAKIQEYKKAEVFSDKDLETLDSYDENISLAKRYGEAIKSAANCVLRELI